MQKTNSPIASYRINHNFSQTQFSTTITFSSSTSVPIFKQFHPPLVVMATTNFNRFSLGYLIFLASGFINTLNGEEAPIRVNCGSHIEFSIDGVTWDADRNCMT